MEPEQRAERTARKKAGESVKGSAENRTEESGGKERRRNPELICGSPGLGQENSLDWRKESYDTEPW